jgi:hypothetical protein
MKKIRKMTKGSLLLVIILLMTNCVTEEVDKQNIYQSVNVAKIWFDANKSNYNNSMLEYVKDLQWEDAIVSNGEKGEIIEIPFTLKGNLRATNKEVNLNNDNHRLMFVKEKDNDYKLFYVQIYTEENLNKNINYYSIVDDFRGKIFIQELTSKIGTKLEFRQGKKIIQSITAKYDSMTCLYFGYWFEDGSFQPLYEVGCFGNDNGSGGNPGDNLPSSYGGGGGGSSYGTNIPQTVSDPCNQIRDILNYNSNEQNSFKASVNWLKGKVNSAVNDKECGVEIKKLMNPDESYRYEFNQVLSVDQFSVPLTTGFSYVGGIHSHPADGYAMFSYQDVRFLLEAYDGASDSRKGEVFNSIVCKDNAGNTNVYMIKIDNIDALRTQVNAVWNDAKYAGYSIEKEKIEAIHLDQGIKYAKSEGQLEKSFLKQFATFGISIYRADSELNSFRKLTLDNSRVASTSCN